MADQFCLRWNNFQSNIVSALDSLKCSEDLVDVTLTCEGKNIKAHKVILSACSPYFRSVFKENPCQHPVIILKDVSSDDIVSLLSYMYQGEVFIEESKLSSFLHTAALLQVKGLTGVTQQKESFATPSTSNKLYTQLTISSKNQYAATPKEGPKLAATKKRRSSTSDKPNDISAENYKKGKFMESINFNNLLTNIVPIENNSDKRNNGKSDSNINTNGKMPATQPTNPSVEDSLPIKMEQFDEEDLLESMQQGPSGNTDNDNDTLPDYENSMLARSLISGINPSKCDMNPNSPLKTKLANKLEATINRPKDPNESVLTKSPLKTFDDSIKVEKRSPKSDVEYEPEILLSEQNDETDSESYSGETSQVLLPGMSTYSSTASTSQTNHAAICGDCPHCGKKYSNQSALKYHVRLMHSDLSNRLCCYLCPCSFTMRETYRDHMWTAHGQRN